MIKMPFNMQWDGADELLRKMDKLPEKAAKIAAEALYEGAGVMADAVSREIHGISTEKFQYAAGGEKRLPSPEEKQILMNAKHGVAKFKNNGIQIQTSIGFQKSGYGKITWNHARTNIRTKYKMGKKGHMVHASQGSGDSMKPVPLIANAINHGTSFMKEQPFLRKAFSKNQRAAIATVEDGIKAREDELELD